MSSPRSTLSLAASVEESSDELAESTGDKLATPSETSSASAPFLTSCPAGASMASVKLPSGGYMNSCQIPPSHVPMPTKYFGPESVCAIASRLRPSRECRKGIPSVKPAAPRSTIRRLNLVTMVTIASSKRVFLEAPLERDRPQSVPQTAAARECVLERGQRTPVPRGVLHARVGKAEVLAREA